MECNLMNKTVRDQISGFEGTVIGVATYLHSMAQVYVAPHGLKDGKPVDPIWFDIGRIERCETGRTAGFLPITADTDVVA